jgi:hypothetical protein
MPRHKKRDHTALSAKLAIRRHYLRRHHSEAPPHVLDCFAGSGTIWHILRTQFPVASYTAIDLKPQPPRLQIDAANYLAAAPHADIIDLDAYGSPWTCYRTITANRPATPHTFTVFLTSTVRGRRGNPGRLPTDYLAQLGLQSLIPTMPIGFHSQLHLHGLPYAIHSAAQHSLEVVEAHYLAINPQIVYAAAHLRRTASPHHANPS